VTEPSELAHRFEQLRPYLGSVAYAMLGSVSEAEDAVQEAWLRLERVDFRTIDDLRGWLTTVICRIALGILRSRKSRPIDYVGTWLPEPLVAEPSDEGPEAQALLADSVGLALLVVLENLNPTERLAFVLHDVFGMPFQEIGPIIGRSTDSARQLASRARRRVRSAPQPEADAATQRRVVDAFLDAARAGNFADLIGILAPDVVLRFDLGPDVAMPDLVGAEIVANHVLATAPRFIGAAKPVLVNGAVGALFGTRSDPISVLGFTVVDGLIAALNLIVNPAKLRHLKVEARSEENESRFPGGE
jgi:RNA polymerase sigma-70 factor (ECF subfamily)